MEGFYLSQFRLWKADFEDKIADDLFLVADTRKISWEICPEKSKVGEWNCQLAVADFAGRKWNAWFCTAIPLPEGPYKFYGLPGLIVKVADSEQLHQFTLVAIQNLTPKSDTKIEMKLNETGFGFDSKPISVSLEKYDKLLKDFRADPTASFRQMLQTKNITFSNNGVALSKEEAIRSREEYYRKRMEKFNNPIELDVLK